MNPLPIIVAALVTLYAIANIVFAFLPAPAWLEPRLGPDRRTRGLLFFLPDAAVEKVGRALYGGICLAFAGFMIWVATL